MRLKCRRSVVAVPMPVAAATASTLWLVVSQQFLGAADPLDQPLQRGGPGYRSEVAPEVARAHVRPSGHRSLPQRLLSQHQRGKLVSSYISTVQPRSQRSSTPAAVLAPHSSCSSPSPSSPVGTVPEESNRPPRPRRGPGQELALACLALLGNDTHLGTKTSSLEGSVIEDVLEHSGGILALGDLL